MDSIKYDLKLPIDGLEGKLSSVTIRQPVRVADMMYVAQMAPSEKVEQVYLVARMCGLEIQEIEKLELGDYNAINALLMGKGKAGAGTSSNESPA